jgi:hypothetical protein
MVKFVCGVLVGAICALTSYITGPLRKAEENARISGFVSGANLVLLAANEEFVNAQASTARTGGVDAEVAALEKALLHIQGWRICGVKGLLEDWPGAYRRLQAVGEAHPGTNPWRAHIAAFCSAHDLGDTQ